MVFGKSMRIMWVVLIALTTVRAQVNPNQGVESIVPVIDSSLPTDNTIVDGNSMGSSTTTTATTATTLLSKKTGSTVTTVGTDTTTGADVTATFTTTIGDSSDNKTPVMMVPNCELETIEQFQAEAGALQQKLKNISMPLPADANEDLVQDKCAQISDIMTSLSTSQSKLKSYKSIVETLLPRYQKSIAMQKQLLQVSIGGDTKRIQEIQTQIKTIEGTAVVLSNGVSVTEEPALTIIGKYKTILNLLSICGIKYGVDKDKGTLCLTELGKRMERRMTILKGLQSGLVQVEGKLNEIKSGLDEKSILFYNENENMIEKLDKEVDQDAKAEEQMEEMEKQSEENKKSKMNVDGGIVVNGDMNAGKIDVGIQKSEIGGEKIENNGEKNEVTVVKTETDDANTVKTDVSVETPAVKSDVPAEKTETPVDKTESPAVKTEVAAEVPDVKTEGPAVKTEATAEGPAVKTEVPADKVETPVVKTDTPAVKTDTPPAVVADPASASADATKPAEVVPAVPSSAPAPTTVTPPSDASSTTTVQPTQQTQKPPTRSLTSEDPNH